MKRFLLATVLLLTLFNGALPVFGEVGIIKKRLGSSIAYKLRCRKEGDLSASPIPGFLRIVIDDDSPQEVHHLPIKDISQIDQYDDGVYIRWPSVRMKNENRYGPVFVYIPKDIEKPQKVIRTIKKQAVSRNK